MNKKELLKIVEFCILMQNNEGILGKAPSYINEKYNTVDGTGVLLDSKNQSIFNNWKEIWFKEAK